MTISIVRQDCLTFLRGLPDESVDIVTTDPAYSGMNEHLNLGTGRIVGEYATKEDWFEEFRDTPENYRALLAASKRVLRPNRHLYLMFDSYSLLTLGPLVREFFDVKGIICWDKVNIGMGHNYRRRHEFILFASKGKRKITRRDIPDVWNIPRVTALYPTQKPVELFEGMLIASAEPGFVVCDPFVGSGSSAVAAIKRGCSFTGADTSESAVQHAARRVNGYHDTGVDPGQKPLINLPAWMTREVKA